MDYKVIILGATFVSAGLCTVLGDDCLVIDSRPNVGYEFVKTLNFGTGYNTKPTSDEAKSLADTFFKKGALKDGRVCLFPCDFAIHSLVDGKNIMLNMKIVSVKKKDGFFEVTAYGVSGYRTYTAQKVIDTRAIAHECASKSINVLVSGKGSNPLVCADGYEILLNHGYETDAIIKCPVKKNADYIVARRAIERLAHNLSDGWKIVISADEFDYSFETETTYCKNDIVHIVSASFKNPLTAFDAGVLFAKEGGLL